ncbi:AAA domain-containing protein [Patescibacteria group bacterium]
MILLENCANRSNKTINTSTKKTLPFIKSIAKYFMDFLETDFHKRRNPKRSIKYKNNSNLLVGVNLKKYTSFNPIVWKAITRSFDKDVLKKVKKGVYRTEIPENLLDLVKLQVKKVNQKQVNETLVLSAEEIHKKSVYYKKEYDQALNGSLEETSRIFRKKLVTPFISSIEKSLENLNLADENDIFLMEDELTSILVNSIQSKVSEVIRLIIAKEDVDIVAELLTVVDAKSVKANIINFFENYKVGDLFAELYELDRNKAILDKQEFYLYFCDITYNKAKYPIFYIPLAVLREGESLHFEFDSQVYINKRALEYITQEHNLATEKKGSLQQIGERILYLAQFENNLLPKLQSIVDEIANFFELDNSIMLTDNQPQSSKGFFISVSNTCYISLFDKSDEALVNDYEDILELIDAEDSELAIAFSQLIDDFIHIDPKSINLEVDQEWDDAEVTDKLVFSSPVPLNSEQLQILSALKKPGCKYVAVEGPPGTGKSHTITAIAFDFILKGKSILILSDKKEALDVVENKITEALNRVRHDKNFQNPILRLGKTGNTYNKILSGSSIDNIKTHYRAIRKEKESIQTNKEKLTNSLKDDLEAEILSYQEISLAEIKELIDLESYISNKTSVVDIDEILNRKDSPYEIEELHDVLVQFREGLNSAEKLDKLLNLNLEKITQTNTFLEYVEFGELLISSYQKIEVIHGDDLQLLTSIDGLSREKIDMIQGYLDKYKAEKVPLFGYIFKKKRLEEIDKLFCIDFSFPDTFKAHKKIDDLEKMVFLCNSIDEYRKENWDKIYESFNLLGFIRTCLIDGNIIPLIKQFTNTRISLEKISTLEEKFPNTFEKSHINSSSLNSLMDNKFLQIPNSDFEKLIRYIYLSKKVEKDFSNIPETEYLMEMKMLEELVTTETTYQVDKRLINFYENNKATATTLRNIIRTKQRFPKKEFEKLREAFPCILAGIRDYAEFIPLEPDIFDLVIIDEASQVSIAQAFPALLRAKQILILGDKKQFSNVKSAQARTVTNREYLNDLEKNFKKNVSTNTAKLTRLTKFNIKTSILEFFEFISNYRIQLTKHFRGYKEIISYSNEYFYEDSLQVMKIRGKPISEVLKFKEIKHDGKEEIIKNTNRLEVDYILKELMKLKESNNRYSVGIITPHTNQQKLLVEMINKSEDKDYFFNELKLKIMTFDTCQGEERDIIYYSLVATRQDDRLWGVFIKDLSSVDIEDEGKIKAQRLNVGFSRAKENMHFVLSKPISDYDGSIGEALRHYSSVYKDALKERSIDETDKKSAMEPKVLNWFYQTEFWKQNKNNVNFIPQFKLGKYLKQLDKTYQHPEYKIDFLLTFIDETGREHKIIIEYDGFEDHFKDLENVNRFNYENYYTENDMYRQKQLEGYGYTFIRINKFNMGDNPISTLNNRIDSAIKEKKSNNALIGKINSTIESLNSGEMKECPKCKKLRTAEEFHDSTLISGVGRFCKQCKSTRRPSVSFSTSQVSSDYNCPKCNSKMVLRTGKYGKFYGCSRFPYCRGTKPYTH